MSQPKIDPNELAVLLDNAATPEERAALLARVNESEADYEVLLEAAALLRDLDAVAGDDGVSDGQHLVRSEASAPPTGTRAIRTALRARGQAMRWLVPTGLAAAAAVILLLNRGPLRDSPAEAPLRLAAALDATPGIARGMAAAFGPEWSEPGWTILRGGAGEASMRAAEFRLGVRAADVALAIRHGDQAAAVRVFAETASLLRTIPGAGLVAEQFSALASAGGAAAAAELADAQAGLTALLGDSPQFQLGAWTEFARLATAAQVQSFFDADSRRTLQRIRELMVREDAQMAVPIDALLRGWRNHPDATTARRIDEILRASG